MSLALMAAESKEIAFVHQLDSHELKLLNNLHFQWKDGIYCDLVIFTEHQPLLVHSCVMSAFSPKIASLVLKQSLQKKVGVSHVYTIEVKFKYDVMESIIAAIYTGFFQPPAKLLKEVLLAAKWLKITELIDAIKKFKDSEVELERMSLFYKNNSDQFIQIALSSALSSSQAVESSGNADTVNVELCDLVLSPSVDVNSFSLKRNIHVTRKQKSRGNSNVVVKIPQNNKHQKSEELNDRKEINNVCVPQPHSITELSETKTEIDDMIYNNNNIQPTVRSLRSSKAVKKKGTYTTRAVRPKVDNSNLKPKVKTDEGKRPGHKSSTKKVKENNADPKSKMSGQQESEILVECGRIRDEGEVKENLVMPKIEENYSDVLIKEEPNLIVDQVHFFKCTKCYAKFTDMDLYHGHVENHPTFQCNDCGQTFFSKFSLSSHIRFIHSSMDYLICRHCGFEAKSQVQLRKHSADVHNDRKPFPCSHAGCKFTALKQHQVLKHMVVHSKVREFTCDKCNMSFSRPIGLTSHQRACLQMQQFLCDLCGQSFNHIQSMRKHRRVIHFGEKPYQCSVCSNSFGDHRNLHRHMRIHDNSFPYSCPVCKQQFRHSNSLKTHVASKHKDNPESISLNISNNLSGTLGGASYKRILKNDLINTMTSRVGSGRGASSRKRSHRVKRRGTSPTEMFVSSTFHGEFLIPQEDSNFDVSSSNDLEFVMNGTQHIDGFSYSSVDQNVRNGTVNEDDAEDISQVASGDGTSISMQLTPHVLPAAPSIWTEKITSPKPCPLSLDQPNNTLPIITISGPIEAHSSVALSMAANF